MIARLGTYYPLLPTWTYSVWQGGIVTPPPLPTAAASTPAWRHPSKASAEENGRFYGRKWQGDAWAMARAQGVQVHLVSHAFLLRRSGRPARPGFIKAGLCLEPLDDGDEWDIYINKELPPAEQDRTLAHEIAHYLYFGEDEAFANSWALAFVGQG